MTEIKERRIEIRIPLIHESCTWTVSDNIEFETVQMNDISLNGAFIKTLKQPELNKELEIRLTLPGDLGILPLKASIQWRRWHSPKKSKLPVGFAVKFKFDNLNIKKVMEAYCVYMRNRQIITVSKRIIEEFFGTPLPEGPKP